MGDKYLVRVMAKQGETVWAVIPQDEVEYLRSKGCEIRTEHEECVLLRRALVYAHNCVSVSWKAPRKIKEDANALKAQLINPLVLDDLDSVARVLLELPAITEHTPWQEENRCRLAAIVAHAIHQGIEIAAMENEPEASSDWEGAIRDLEYVLQ